MHKFLQNPQRSVWNKLLGELAEVNRNSIKEEKNEQLSEKQKIKTQTEVISEAFLLINATGLLSPLSWAEPSGPPQNALLTSWVTMPQDSSITALRLWALLFYQG